MTAGRKELSEADRADWAAYASRVTPLPGRERPSAPLALAEPAPTKPVRGAIAPSRRAARVVPSSVAIGTQPGGVDKASWDRFRTGKIHAARTLDLHGYTVQRAYHALLGFLRVAHADRVRSVEIVTGRGSTESGGAIRRELPLWLNLPEIRPLILGAVHPHPANPGAVRLLLRRLR